MAKAIARRKARATTIPIAVVAGLIPAGSTLMSAYQQAGLPAVMQHASMMTTGYDPTDGRIKIGYAVQKLYGPLAIGFIAHTLATKLGVNRMLSRAGVPLIRI